MLKKWLGWPKRRAENTPLGILCDKKAPDILAFELGRPFLFSDVLHTSDGFAFLDWNKVWNWIEQDVLDEFQDQAWRWAQQGWLLHLRDQLGDTYNLIEDETNFVLSPLERHLTDATLAFMNRAKQRVLEVLQGMASGNKDGCDILIICKDDEDYYSYVTNFYADEEVEIARSGGMFLNAGCQHFITTHADLSFMEPVIVHELTHNYLAHLPLPLWLNEGIAVNVEQRLAGSLPGELTPQELFHQHQNHWNAKTIQAFWSGESFRRQDTMLLSYDLAARMVTIFAKDWLSFTSFVLEACYEDAGNEAVQKYFDASLGYYASAMLGKDEYEGWEPQ